MSKKKSEHKNKGYLESVIGCHCPRCREGKLFEHPVSFNLKKVLKMNKTCPVCEQPTEIEVGFYYGTGYVSYAVAIAVSVVTFIAWWIIIGISVNDNRILYWLIFNAIVLLLVQPFTMRFARSLWISWFVKYDPDWAKKMPVGTPERTNKDQANNW